MAPFELLLLSALVATSAGLPTNSPMPMYRGIRTGFTNNKPTEVTDQPQRANLDGLQNIHSKYQCFNGDSTVSVSASSWLCFNDLWRINEATILSKNGGDTYIKHYIKEAILHVASESALDSRLILAFMMQESSGRASIPCKSQSRGGSKCGLMQAMDGSTFDATNPAASILQMLRDGMDGDGLDQALDGDERYLSDVANRLLGWDGRGAGFVTCAA
ncbi:hypothetical protein LTR36_001234 [Oleoguttula mirabilis]|uniref:Uncharacterized protein n=1 Tax=Oleoguttula mirabilis TaxID=1507867 RepID=A0AAV9JNQ9_9PEZI|nr:hypothetical protein LTR36_001234 [Oleoguttula mirabilis]